MVIKKDLKNICNIIKIRNNLQNITIKKNHDDELVQKNNDLNVINCTIVIHNMRDLKMIAIYLATEKKQSRTKMKQYVFGGKIIQLKDAFAFDRAITFTNKLTKKIIITSPLLQHFQIAGSP